MVDYDNGYKLLFSHAEMVEELLRGFVREDWVDQVDFHTLEKTNGSYVSEELRDRHDDIVWRVKIRDRWLYVYLLIEFQSTIDPFMAVRLMAYIGLLYQDLIRGKEIPARGLLPPVLPMVLYNGRSRWNAAQNVEDLIEPVPGQLSHWRPRLPYLLIDEWAVPEADLTNRNLVSKLFQLERCRTPDQVKAALIGLTDWLQAPGQASLRRSFTVWFHRILFSVRLRGQEIPELQNLQEVHIMLEEQVREWTQQWKDEGRAEGKAALDAAQAAAQAAQAAQAAAKEENAQRLLAAAQRLLAKGIPASDVAECMGIPLPEIEALKARPSSVSEPVSPYAPKPSQSSEK